MKLGFEEGIYMYIYEIGEKVDKMLPQSAMGTKQSNKIE